MLPLFMLPLTTLRQALWIPEWEINPLNDSLLSDSPCSVTFQPFPCSRRCKKYVPGMSHPPLSLVLSEGSSKFKAQATFPPLLHPAAHNSARSCAVSEFPHLSYAVVALHHARRQGAHTHTKCSTQHSSNRRLHIKPHFISEKRL